MKKASKIDPKDQDLVQLLSNDEVALEFGESVASVVPKDKIVTWAKFILTDDKPNGNGERIPLEEFDNLISTGLFKPVKMAVGEIKDGHEDAAPLGVITNLVKDGNRIVALAALWDVERESDVAYVKNLVNSSKPVNVSWELFYEESRIVDGVRELLGTILRAVTIVGMPAYAGRTQFIAVAAKKWTPSYIESLPDSNFLYVASDGSRHFAYRDHTGKIDISRLPDLMEEVSKSPLPENTLKSVRHTIKKLDFVVRSDASIKEVLGLEEEFNMEDSTLDIEKLTSKVAELETALESANSAVTDKDSKIQELESNLALAQQENESLKNELEPLREFKSQEDAKLERIEKLSAIKEKFSSVGLQKEDTYFDENAEKLLSLDESGLDFLLQEMVAFAESGNGSEASKRNNSVTVPNLSGDGAKPLDIKDLASALRDLKKSNN